MGHKRTEACHKATNDEDPKAVDEPLEQLAVREKRFAAADTYSSETAGKLRKQIVCH